MDYRSGTWFDHAGKQGGPEKGAYLPWAQPRLSRSPDLERTMAEREQARPVQRITASEIVVIPKGQHTQVRDHASAAAYGNNKRRAHDDR